VKVKSGKLFSVLAPDRPKPGPAYNPDNGTGLYQQQINPYTYSNFALPENAQPAESPEPGEADFISVYK